jgi:hypothetical protein
LLLLREELLRLEPDLLPDDAEARLLADLLPEDEDLLLLPLALARSLWALLFCVLALPPLLAACARLILPEEDEDDADGLEDAEGFEAEEEEELRDAMASSFGRLVRAALTAAATYPI